MLLFEGQEHCSFVWHNGVKYFIKPLNRFEEGLLHSARKWCANDKVAHSCQRFVTGIFTAATMASTRTKITKIYPDFGIETALEEFLGSQVPSNVDVLRHYFFWNREKKASVFESYMNTAKNALCRWRGSGVPLLHPTTLHNHVKTLHGELL